MKHEVKSLLLQVECGLATVHEFLSDNLERNIKRNIHEIYRTTYEILIALKISILSYIVL